MLNGLENLKLTGAKFHVSVKICCAIGYLTLGTSKTLLNSSVLVTVNSIVRFDVSREIYHGEFSLGNVGHTR